MSYDKEKYDALRKARVPHKMALSLAQDTLPNIGADRTHLTGEPIEHLAEMANPNQNTAKINEIIDRLNEVIQEG
jgi:hypothetical protein